MYKALIVWISLIACIAGLAGCKESENVAELKAELAQAKTQIKLLNGTIANKKRECDMLDLDCQSAIREKQNIEAKYQALTEKYTEMYTQASALQLQYQTQSSELYSSVEQQILQYEQTIAEQDAYIAELEAILAQYESGPLP